ncbi:MAG: hypothetical protein FWH03_06075 [Firmicutes bacterium]|nr:hypothetical protein [Bacillota bacterium]
MKTIKFYNPDKSMSIYYSKEEQFLIKGYNSIQEKLLLDAKTKIEHRSVVIEFGSTGHHNSYALLGVEYFPPETKTDYLVIEVRYDNGKTKKFKSDIAFLYKDIKYGLPKEYAEFILSKVTKYINENPFLIPTGKIIFSMGAHCELCSASDIFGRIAKMLVHIIFSKYDKTTEGELKEIYSRYF